MGLVQANSHSSYNKLNNTEKKMKKYAGKHLESKLNDVQTSYCRNHSTDLEVCLIQRKHVRQ